MEVAFGRRCCNDFGECSQAVRARVEQRYKIWAPHALLSAGSQTLWPLIMAAIDPLWLSLVSSNRGSPNWAAPGYRVVAANLHLVCSRCRTPASLLCACRRVRYCSRACQRKHWKDAPYRLLRINAPNNADFTGGAVLARPKHGAS